MLRDKGIGWNRKRIFIPAWDMLGLLEATNLITSLGAGTPVFAETLAAAQIAGLRINAAGNEIFHVMPIPWDMDISQPMRFRTWFTHTTADLDSPIWKVFYKFFGKAVAITAANSSPDETVTFAAHANAAVANAIEVTAWAASLSHTFVTQSDFGILLCTECDSLGGASANEIDLLGLEIQYTIGAAEQNARLLTRVAPTTGTGPKV